MCSSQVTATKGFSGCISYLKINDYVVNLTNSLSSMAITECIESQCDATCNERRNDLFGISNNKYACRCNNASLLPICHLDVDECALGQDNCSQGTKCVNTLNGFDCIFKCTCDTCYNNGTCQEHLYSGIKTCECQSNYTGLRCETYLDGCWPSPCVHGTCVPTESGATCLCRTGFTGRYCDVEIIDKCLSSPCDNQGTCSDHVCGYTCTCKDGYAGANCDININECASNPCKENQLCQDDINRYRCVRVHNACDDNVCEHDGVCLRLSDKNHCYCTNGYHGVHCEVEFNECSSGLCSNGSSCVDGIGNYTCVCLPEFTGRHCDIVMTDCEISECGSNGKCMNGTCICLNGYTGNRCESEIDPCLPSSCDYGAKCVPDYPSYTCSCPTGAIGRHCEIFLYCGIHSGDFVSDFDDLIPISYEEGAVQVSWKLRNTSNKPETKTGFRLLRYLLEYSTLDNLFARNVTVNGTDVVFENLNYMKFRFRIASIINDQDKLVCSNFSHFSRPVTPNISR